MGLYTTVTGKALAALAEGYVEAVNRPGALPDLNQGWQAVVRLELREVSYRLVREYEREMEEATGREKPPENPPTDIEEKEECSERGNLPCEPSPLQ